MRSLVPAVAAALLAAGCGDSPSAAIQGYAEGEFLLLASPYPGTLAELAVARGQQVAAGAPLFALEHAAEDAQVAEARSRLAGAQARLANLESGRRKPEVDAVRAQILTARAARDLAAQQLKQQLQLRADGFVAQARVDEARASLDRARAQLAEAEAQQRVATQSLGRAAEREAARAEAEAARAALAQSEWRLAQKSAAAPAAALVHDTYFSPGEWVGAGAPVVSLLPPGNIKLRFYVPETMLGGLRTGAPVSVRCEGCGAAIAATVNYVSPQPEYTPPVLYSKEARAKLVFRVEAKPAAADAMRLKPGQPVDVTLAPP